MARTTTTTASDQLLSAGTLKGTNVVNLAGENVGSLEEIMLHLDTGDVAYAVLSFGGFLGMGDKLFALPWQALTVDTVKERITVDIDKQRLENAPGFDKNAWPESADSAWLERVHTHYGYDYPGRRR